MKNLAALIALAAVVVLAAGCSNPTAQADSDISSVNAHLNAAAASEAKAKDLTTQLGAVSYTKAGAAQALTLITQMQAELNTQKTELQAAQSKLGSATKLDIKPELKKYIQLESAAIDTRIEIVDAGLQLYDETGQMYQAISAGKSNNVAMNKITATMDQSSSQIEALTLEAATQTQAASSYFAAHKLGGQ
jgi:hypothetical protein